jgi:hypothetical protein
VVRGTRDQIVSQRWAEQATRILSNAQLAIIPSAGHAINFSNPVEFKKVLIPFLLGSEPAQETEATVPRSHAGTSSRAGRASPAHRHAL